MTTQSPEANMRSLAQNPYPGRGIVIGLNDTGEYFVQIYWIMGRSENSRNRIFTVRDTEVSTEAADPTKVQDSSLIIYKAMQEKEGVYIVSNGKQTEDVLRAVTERKYKLVSALSEYQYEPDAPNFTPRITGICNLIGKCPFGLAILRKSSFDKSCERICYYYEKIPAGLGFCITTYTGDGDPLPAFQGEPILMPIIGEIQDVARQYWNCLNKEHRVSLAVKVIDKLTGKSNIAVINKYKKVT